MEFVFLCEGSSSSLPQYSPGCLPPSFLAPLTWFCLNIRCSSFFDRRQDLGGWVNPTTPAGQLQLLVLCIGLASFSCFAALFVNINRFSLYDLYRMRLTREFLGASNAERRPEVWTGFDETDDIPLARSLATQK